MYWHFRTLKYKIRHIIRWPRYARQRVTRGFSDRDMWNADAFLARTYADILMWYVHKGMGVPTCYLNNWDDPVAEAAERRDADYYKYADIFRRYAKGGEWHTEDHVKEFGGVLDKEMEEALQWMSKHFQELWD